MFGLLPASFIHHHMKVAGYYGLTLIVCVCVCLSFRPFVYPSVVCPSVFSFSDDNFGKCQWIFSKLSVCIDIVEIRFGIANGQISSIFDRVMCLRQIEFFVSG